MSAMHMDLRQPLESSVTESPFETNCTATRNLMQLPVYWI
jgi:hypothetical protein